MKKRILVVERVKITHAIDIENVEIEDIEKEYDYVVDEIEIETTETD